VGVKNDDLCSMPRCRQPMSVITPEGALCQGHHAARLERKYREAVKRLKR
jgi:hypothetical protein